MKTPGMGLICEPVLTVVVTLLLVTEGTTLLAPLLATLLDADCSVALLLDATLE
jgi:hypothetical protein